MCMYFIGIAHYCQLTETVFVQLLILIYVNSFSVLCLIAVSKMLLTCFFYFLGKLLVFRVKC